MKINNLEIYGIIYKIRNKINNKVYFGQTTLKGGFDERYNKDLKTNTHNEHLKRSINKYGIENFEIDKEFDIAYSQEELDKLEDMYIKVYNTTNKKHGYNKKFGGSHGKHTKETRKKLSDVHKGKSPTEETRKKLSISLMGKNKGKKHTKEQNLLNSMVHKGKNKGKDNVVSRKVVCLNTKECFDCIEEGGLKYNIKSTSHITNCCRRNQNSRGKHPITGEILVWAYKEDFLKMTTQEIEKRILFANTCKGKDKIRTIICITTGNIFYGLEEAGKCYDIKSISHIGAVCRGKRNYCGQLKDGTKLKWKYISDLTSEEYIKYDIENKLKELSSELNNKTQKDSSFLIQ